MKFTVIFRTKSRMLDDRVCDLKEQRVGLEFLNQAREAANLPDLEVARVNSYLPYFNHDVKIEISEELARESELFQKTCTVDVLMHCKALNKYTHVGVDIQKDNRTGEILYISPKYHVDKKAVLASWKEAGYPTEWNLNDQEV